MYCPGKDNAGIRGTVLRLRERKDKGKMWKRKQMGNVQFAWTQHSQIVQGEKSVRLGLLLWEFFSTCRHSVV